MKSEPQNCLTHLKVFSVVVLIAELYIGKYIPCKLGTGKENKLGDNSS